LRFCCLYHPRFDAAVLRVVWSLIVVQQTPQSFYSEMEAKARAWISAAAYDDGETVARQRFQSQLKLQWAQRADQVSSALLKQAVHQKGVVFSS
jgi:hypothetical protein